MENLRDSFLTIASESRGVYREKASKFLAIAIPVSTEEEIRTKLEALKKTYHNANHHCFAYRLGLQNPLFRVNDDGEPAGSAGKPIYGQILSTGLSDILVVVIRYFGGTKLGIPGLIHAYKTSAREALDNAEIIEKLIHVHFRVSFEYAKMNEVMRILKEEGVKIAAQNAGIRCEIDFFIRKSHANNIENRIKRLKNVIMEIVGFPN
jgi:uncharacterized YigZ family protein